MSLQLPAIRVGEPIRYQGLAVFPLFAANAGQVDYRLADEAMAASALVVEEISESGSVPELFVENKCDQPVLFLEGEELRGAKQNRVLNTSVLVAAGMKLKIPVSCVERGRWRSVSATFKSGNTMTSSALRYKLKESVTHSTRERRGHRSDQGAVWKKVAEQQQSLGVSSSTGAMSDSFISHADQIADYKEKVQYPEGCTGVAVGLGDKVVALDVFDKPATCRKVWDRLLSGFALDALAHQAGGKQADPIQVRDLLNESWAAAWSETQPVGEGQEYRTEFGTRQGSALASAGTLIHLSVLAEC